MFATLGKLLLPRKWQRNLSYLRDLAARMDSIEATADRAAQGLARLVIQETSRDRDDITSLEQSEFRLRSQWGEDGILHYIFAEVGRDSRTFVEFGIQSGRECNAAHLALSEGWSGLFIEGDPRFAASAREYYAMMLGPNASRVQVVNSFITVENINRVLSEAHVEGTLDLLSIDIDGNDYWVWEAISVVQPRVVAIEYNGAFGPVQALTIPYNPDFQRSSLGNGMYYGASLAALAKLGSRKQYSLVGCGSNGINAFFVRRDLVGSRLREISVKDAFRPHFGLSRELTLEQQFDLVRKLPLIEV